MPGDDVCIGAGYKQAFLVKVGAVDKDLVVNVATGYLVAVS